LRSIPDMRSKCMNDVITTCSFSPISGMKPDQEAQYAQYQYELERALARWGSS
jgi:hypothetical protein